MPPRRVLPSSDELLKLRRQGKSNIKIAEQYGVTPAAVSAALGREGKSESTKKYPDLIPWRVSINHSNDYNLRMLRWEGQIRDGRELPEFKRKALASWRAKLMEKKAVVHYDNELGFFLVPKRPQDKDLIRSPEQNGAAA